MTQNNGNWERIYAIISRAQMTTNYFARYIGLPYGENLYQIKRGNNGISRDVAERIVSKFPEISKAWILTGEGSMYVDEKSRSAQIPFYDDGVEAVLRNPETASPTYYMFVPPLHHCDLAVTYRPSEERSDSGQTVLFLTKTDKEGIISGREYVIVCKNSIFLRKFRMFNGGQTLKSLNNGKKQNAITVETEDAEAIYRVDGKLTIKQ